MKEYMLSVLQGFIPIFLVYTFVCFPDQFIVYANTTLGKLYACAVIALYSMTSDWIYGLLASITVIAFYQTDYVSAMSMSMSIPINNLATFPFEP